MYGTSVAFQRAVTQSHRVALDARIGAGFSASLKLVSGSVQVDRTAQYRRGFNATLIDRDQLLIPTLESGDLSPYGSEIKLFRGVRFNDGTIEMCPLGVFRISSASVEDDGAPVISLNGYDRSRTISRNKFTDTYIIAAGTNYSTAIQNLITNRLPGTTCLFSSTTQTTPALFFDPASDPWVEATEMARVIGMELFFDVNGNCVLQPEPVVSLSPVATLPSGDGSTLLKVTKQLSDEPGINGVIVTSETTSGTPARGEAWDSDPDSPTYYLGPYGKVPTFETSPYAVTAAQCTAAAKAILQKQIGAAESASCSSIPNPALAEGDSVQVTRTESGVAATLMLESFTVPLDVGAAMDLRFRTRRVVT